MTLRRLTLLFLLATTALHAQQERLKLVIILTRHGVRSPTWTQDRLNTYSALPWPTWSVPPGDLTPHGYALLTNFGQHDRALYAAKGLFAATGCADSASVFIHADTDQRTLASGRALAEGLFPHCPPALDNLPAGSNDPLFHTDAVPTPAQSAAALAELQTRLTDTANLPDPTLISQLQNVLLNCAPTATTCTPTHPAAALLPSGDPITAVAGKGDHLADLKGALPTASTLSEDLLLEYADAMPLANVGWGHVDEPKLRRFLALHTAYFDLLHRTPALARLSAADMLRRITQTLQQAVADKPVPGALGTPSQKLVLLVGHDTNLAAIAALLHLHWTLDGRTDDTPPGTELAFELWQTGPATYVVRLTASAQTLTQMHNTRPETLPAPPSAAISPADCGTPTTGCRWPDFQHLITATTAAP
jgi:4-phytase/acid phosphatase